MVSAPTAWQQRHKGRGIVSNIFAEGETIRGQGKKERNEIKHKKKERKENKSASGSGKQASSPRHNIVNIYTARRHGRVCVAISSEYIVCARCIIHFLELSRTVQTSSTLESSSRKEIRSISSVSLMSSNQLSMGTACCGWKR